MMYKNSLSSLQFIFKLKALVLLALSPNKQKVLAQQHNNHKIVEILCCESKNLKDKVIHISKLRGFCCSSMNRFLHRHFDIFADISFLPIHLCA